MNVVGSVQGKGEIIKVEMWARKEP